MTIQRVGVQNAIGFFTWILGDGTNVIPTGLQGYFRCPYGGIHRNWSLEALEPGSIEIDIWRCPFNEAPPTVVDSIVGTDPPRLVNEQFSESVALSGWDTAFDPGEVFGVNVDSATTITRVTLTLNVSR